VAGLLGNTRSVCRKCYVHPAIMDSYLDRSLLETLGQRADAALQTIEGLQEDEVAVLKFLKKRVAAEQKQKAGAAA
jgi:DNA topoisomerase I